MRNQLSKNQEGAIALLTLIAISVFALMVMSTLSVLAANNLQMTLASASSENTFYAAESGLNEALYRLVASPVPEPFSFNLDGVDVQVTVTNSTSPNCPPELYPKAIRSQATDATGKVRTVEVLACSSAFSGGFDYAVQGGTGGVFLDNNSVIVGKVYSNGSILPASGGATGDVTGDVWVASANELKRVRVKGDAHAHTITDSKICGNAYYQTINAASTNFLNNPTSSVCSSPLTPGMGYMDDDSPPRNLPISDSDVQTWKDEITASSNPVLTPNPGECPPSRPSGTYCVNNNDTSLGLQKVEGDFYVGNGKILTLTGNIWVTGKIILDNNGTIKLDPSLGAGSAVIIADGIIDVSNNYVLQGSGNQKSFLLILSTNTSVDPSAPAVYASNNSTSIIFAAIHGMLKVKNNGSLNAATAEILYLEPNSQVTYNPNIAAFTIPGGGGDTIGTALGTWQEK